MLASDETVTEAILDVRAALGREPADLVLRNCQLVNVCSEEIHRATVAIRGTRIVAIRETYDGTAARDVDCCGFYAMPGAIESYFAPGGARPSAETLIAHGVTSVVAAPEFDLGVLKNAGMRCFETGSTALPIQPSRICSNSDEALEQLRQGTTVVLDCGPNPADWRQTFVDLRLRRIDSSRFLARNFADGFVAGEGPLQEAIASGLAPARAQQMTTFNAAIHFALDHEVGSVTPGRHADIVLAREPCGKPEMVVLNGRLLTIPA